MVETNFVIDKVNDQLKKRIKNFDKYRFGFELNNGIIVISCHGAGVQGYETEVDMGGKTFERAINELIPKVINLIKTCKEKSP